MHLVDISPLRSSIDRVIVCPSIDRQSTSVSGLSDRQKRAYKALYHDQKMVAPGFKDLEPDTHTKLRERSMSNVR